jgi:hypothetical protein
MNVLRLTLFNTEQNAFLIEHYFKALLLQKASFIN